ncbi:MAG TPA: FtsX-like permease family protein [Planctomycetota bacterium]|nr:FtsX-like permease family protein [Planctomycetota bacterium]
MPEPALLQKAALVVGAGIAVLALAALVFAIVETLRRAAVLPLAVRWASSRAINLVSVIGVGVGVGALVVVLAIMNGYLAELRRVARGHLSDLTIRPMPAARTKPPTMPGTFEDYRSALAGVRGIAALAPRFVYRGILVPAGKMPDRFELARHGPEFGAEILGVDPAAERRVSDLDKWLSPPDPGDETARGFEPVADRSDPFAGPPGAPPGAIVGVSLATRLGIHRGDVVELVTWSPNETAPGEASPDRRFRVAGMLRTPQQKSDAHAVLIPVAAMRALLGASTPEFTEISVRLDDPSSGERLRPEIGRTLAKAGLIAGKEYEVVTWEMQHGSLLAAVANQRGILGTILFFIIVVAVFLLFATLSMMASEKTRDVGILSALGASGAEILAVFVDVGAAITLAGVVLGIALAALLAPNLDAIERFLHHAFGVKLFNPEIYDLRQLPAEIDPGQVAIIVALTLVAGVLFSIPPALRAARLDPVRALRL